MVVLVRNALFAFVLHISSLMVLFINALFDADSRTEMREEIAKSSEVFHQAVAGGHSRNGLAALRGFCVMAEMIKVRFGHTGSQLNLFDS